MHVADNELMVKLSLTAGAPIILTPLLPLTRPLLPFKHTRRQQLINLVARRKCPLPTPRSPPISPIPRVKHACRQKRINIAVARGRCGGSRGVGAHRESGCGPWG